MRSLTPILLLVAAIWPSRAQFGAPVQLFSTLQPEDGTWEPDAVMLPSGRLLVQ
jgi:hypothetical protein